MKKNMRLLLSLPIVFCLLALTFTSALASLPSGIKVSVSQDVSEFEVSDKILINVSYTNTSDQVLKILRWETVLGGRIDSDMLEVQHKGLELPYTGRVYKRPLPSEKDYFYMAPGEVVNGVVDVLTGYDIDYKGVYEIDARGALKKSGDLANKAVSFTLKQDRPVQFKQTPVVQSCSSARASLINSALGSAESIARRARDDLQNTPVGKRVEAQRYAEWFGAYTEARWNTVQDHFNRIYSAVSGRVLTFICDDSASAFAYVYPSQPYDVYLGQAFWSAPQTGTDSKAGTIIHELSHFNVLGGTDDHVYGQSGARSLARTNPGRAVQNADSHEYFAENTPALSMPSPDQEADPDPDPETDPTPDPDPGPESNSAKSIMSVILQLLLDE